MSALPIPEPLPMPKPVSIRGISPKLIHARKDFETWGEVLHYWPDPPPMSEHILCSKASDPTSHPVWMLVFWQVDLFCMEFHDEQFGCMHPFCVERYAEFRWLPHESENRMLKFFCGDLTYRQDLAVNRVVRAYSNQIL